MILEIVLAVCGAVATVAWEYYREKKSGAKSELQVNLNAIERDIIKINDVFTIKLEAGSISGKVIHVQEGTLSIPGREDIELQDASVNLKKLKVESVHLAKNLDLKKIQKEIKKNQPEEENEAEIRDIADNITNVIENTVSTVSDPKPAKIAKTTMSALKLIKNIGSWMLSLFSSKKSEATDETEPLLSHQEEDVTNTVEESPIHEMDKWITKAEAAAEENNNNETTEALSTITDTTSTDTTNVEAVDIIKTTGDLSTITDTTSTETTNVKSVDIIKTTGDLSTITDTIATGATNAETVDIIKTTGDLNTTSTIIDNSSSSILDIHKINLSGDVLDTMPDTATAAA